MHLMSIRKEGIMDEAYYYFVMSEKVLKTIANYACSYLMRMEPGDMIRMTIL